MILAKIEIIVGYFVSLEELSVYEIKRLDFVIKYFFVFLSLTERFIRFTKWKQIYSKEATRLV